MQGLVLFAEARAAKSSLTFRDRHRRRHFSPIATILGLGKIKQHSSSEPPFSHPHIILPYCQVLMDFYTVMIQRSFFLYATYISVSHAMVLRGGVKCLCPHEYKSENFPSNSPGWHCFREKFR